MGDSDEEYSHNNRSGNNSLNSGGNNPMKKNRDKFHRERDDSLSNNNNNNNPNNQSNYSNRRDWSDERNRSGGDSWKSNNRGGYGGSGGSGNYPRKYTHQSSPGTHGGHDSSPPPQKRRKDWDNNGAPSHHISPSMGPGSGMDYSGSSYHSGPGYAPKTGQHSFGDFKSQNEPDYPTQPPFLSFKLFLQQQDDNITDEEAIKKYNDYKIEFKKTQINNFFLEHKEEEWFKMRYHPDENYKRRNEQNQNILNRLEVFLDLMSKGWLEDVSIENDKSKELTRFLDACVIKLEGGTDQDIKKILDGVDIEAENEKSKNSDQNGDDNENKTKTEEAAASSNSDLEQKSTENGENTSTNNKNEDDAGENNDTKNGKRKSQEDSGSESGAYTDSDSDDTDDKPSSRRSKRKSPKPNSSNKQEQKQLHKTASIFMRNLAPSVTKQDLENLCKQYDGFKRVALSDPAPERGFYRRGWITFESNVDVKKICWNLQNIRIKDSNPGAIVNRELTSRIRPITNLVTHHKSVIKNDIKTAMKIVQNMDKKWNLWQEKSATSEEELSVKEETKQNEEVTTTTTNKENKENEKTETEQKTAENESTTGTKDEATKAADDYAKLEEAGFSKLIPNAPYYLPHKYNGLNPLLENITDYLVDEGSAEEEELLGDDNENKSTSNGSSKHGSSFDIEIDKNYTKVLDKLILYLRVVHSIDFYNAIEYQLEDSMPNRCGIIFARPALPLNAASASLKITQDDINKYIKQFDTKMKPYVEYKEKVEIDLAKKLGIKERKEEIEKFIKTNTQELAPDRWLCPLSGKRFKGPEFIRKHLFYKHMEKIIEVKKEVEYFNNYLFDPKRPQLAEHPSNKSQNQSSSSSQQSPSSNQSYQSSNYSSQMSNQNMGYNSSAGGGSLLGQPMMGGGGGGGQMQFGQMPNRSMNAGWQQPGSGGFMPDMMSGGNYAPNFNPSFGQGNLGAPGGFHHGGFKKPGYSGGQGYQGRRGNLTREMIAYKDLDAPEDY